MPLRIGGTNIGQVYVGDQRISRIYVGSDLVFGGTPAHGTILRESPDFENLGLQGLAHYNGNLYSVGSDAIDNSMIYVISTTDWSRQTSLEFELGSEVRNGSGIVVTSSRIYVLEHIGQERLVVYNHSGTYLPAEQVTISGLSRISTFIGLSFYNGNYYMIQNVQHNVIVFSPSGTINSSLGVDIPSSITEPGGARFPEDIVVSSNRIYIANGDFPGSASGRLAVNAFTHSGVYDAGHSFSREGLNGCVIVDDVMYCLGSGSGQEIFAYAFDESDI